MPEDFAIGIDVTIFGRAMRIYDSDEYTRRFFEVRKLFPLQFPQGSSQLGFFTKLKQLLTSHKNALRQLHFKFKCHAEFKPALAECGSQPHINFQTLCTDTRNTFSSFKTCSDWQLWTVSDPLAPYWRPWDEKLHGKEPRWWKGSFSKTVLGSRPQSSPLLRHKLRPPLHCALLLSWWHSRNSWVPLPQRR